MAKEALQKQADFMFVELGLNAKTIANDLEVSEKTVSAWRKKGNWDKRRNELLASPHRLREILLNETLWIAQGNPPRINADSLTKVNKVFESFGGKITPQTAASVLKHLDQWLAETDPELAIRSLLAHKKFIVHLIAQYG